MALLDFTNKIVVITGAATGMGAATTNRLLDAGAEVHAVDVAPVAAAVAGTYGCDLGRREAIDELVELLPERVDTLMNCAGVPNGGRFGPIEVMAVNWLGLRHLTESLLHRMERGASVVHIASTAGRDWAGHRSELEELVAAETFEAGARWCAAHAEVCGDGYSFSKEAVQYYTHRRAVELIDRGIRMNSICPGITNTRLIDDFRRGMGDAVIDTAASIAGRMAEPDEMAPAMLFLADPRASSYITGVNLNIDNGTGAARAAGLHGS